MHLGRGCRTNAAARPSQDAGVSRPALCCGICCGAAKLTFERHAAKVRSQPESGPHAERGICRIIDVEGGKRTHSVPVKPWDSSQKQSFIPRLSLPIMRRCRLRQRTLNYILECIWEMSACLGQTGLFEEETNVHFGVRIFLCFGSKTRSTVT